MTFRFSPDRVCRFKVPLFVVVLATVSGWLGFYYHEAIGGLFKVWQTEDYSHGPLLVLFALLWGARLLQEEPAMPARPSPVALALIAGGAFLGTLGTFAVNLWIENVSIVLSLAGVAGFFLGLGNLQRLMAPLGLLLFAIPLPPTLAAALTAKMQLWSSDLGVAGLQLIGISVFQEGNVIDVGQYKLYVAEACSGLRYVFPLLGFGYLVACHAFRSYVRRTLLVAGTIPIAIFCNGLRITATGFIADRFGLAYVEGLLHEVEGFVVFALCLAAFAGLYALLRRWPAMSEREPELVRVLPSFILPRAAAVPCLPARALGGLALILLFSAGCYALSSQRNNEAVVVREAFNRFPQNIARWTGTFSRMSEVERKTLLLDDYLLASYRQEASPRAVSLYVAYYASQKQGRSIHSPEICLPGSGWEIVASAPYTVTLADTQKTEVTREIVRKGSDRALVYYWFNQGGENAPDNWSGKRLLLRNAVLHGRTDGSLVRVSIPVDEGQDMVEADKVLSGFVREMWPVLPRYIGSAKSR